MLAKVYTALDRMRELTASGIPFSFSFYTYSETNGTKGVKHVNRAILRSGYSQKQSKVKNESLIAYYDLDADKNGFAYLPLIIILNDIQLR